MDLSRAISTLLTLMVREETIWPTIGQHILSTIARAFVIKMLIVLLIIITLVGLGKDTASFKQRKLWALENKAILTIIYNGYFLTDLKVNLALMEHGYISMKIVYCKRESYLKLIKQFLAVK